MDVLFLISVFRLYPRFKMTFEHNSVRKNLFLSACFSWNSGFSLREMDKILNLLESLVIEIPVWTLYFVTPKYADHTEYCMMLLELCEHKLAKDLATATGLVADQTHVCLVT